MFPILAIDSMLGKPDACFLSDQMRMEILATGLIEQRSPDVPKPLFFETDGGFKDMCEWEGVYCENDAVEKIDWSEQEWLENVEKFSFENLPASLRVLELSHSFFRSTVPLAVLPDGVRELYINNCLFYGTTDLAEVPREMRHL